jgi:hypothetical protein
VTASFYVWSVHLDLLWVQQFQDNLLELRLQILQLRGKLAGSTAGDTFALVFDEDFKLFCFT